MQYILTEEEINNLVPMSRLAASREAIKAMREMIVGDRCIHSRAGQLGQFIYCEQCPLDDMNDDLPNPPTAAISAEMCDLHREYSQ